MNDKAFEVRGPRTVAVKLEDVTDKELIDIARENGIGFDQIEGFVASTAYFEARGSTYLVFEGGNYLTFGDEKFFERYTPAPADTVGEDVKTDGGEFVGIDSSWRDRDTRTVALQQAVALSARGNVADTDTILRQAKRIEDYLTKGDVPEESTPTP